MNVGCPLLPLLLLQRGGYTQQGGTGKCAQTSLPAANMGFTAELVVDDVLLYNVGGSLALHNLKDGSQRLISGAASTASESPAPALHTVRLRSCYVGGCGAFRSSM